MRWHRSPAPASGLRRVERATKAYGAGGTTLRALDDVTVGFGRGQFTAIMGPSGSGKSTLGHCMPGLDTLTSGQAFIGDTDLASLTDRERTILRRDRLGFVFQSFNLLPVLRARVIGPDRHLVRLVLLRVVAVKRALGGLDLDRGGPRGGGRHRRPGWPSLAMWPAARRGTPPAAL